MGDLLRQSFFSAVMRNPNNLDEKHFVSGNTYCKRFLDKTSQIDFRLCTVAAGLNNTLTQDTAAMLMALGAARIREFSSDLLY